MKDNKRKIKKLITMSLIVIAIMVTGIMVLAYNNDILQPTAYARWQVEFTSIAEGEKVGNAKSRKRPEYSSTKASFYVDLVVPGDSITYDLQVSNKGTLDSYLADIIWVTSPNKEAIKYEIIDIKEGDRLNAGESKNFKIRVSYDLDAQEVVTFNKPVSLTFEFKQAF